MKTYADLIRLPTHLETVPAVDQGLRIKRMSQRLWMVREGIKSWCQPQRRLMQDDPPVAPPRIPIDFDDLPAA